MIRGYCIGGGVGLALCCDMRICTEGSKFGVPAAKLGLGYRYDGLKKLVDLVGPSFAKEIFYTARQFTAAEAQTMGLVNRVLPDAEASSRNMSRITPRPSPAMRRSRSTPIKFIVGEVLKDPDKRDLKALRGLGDARLRQQATIPKAARPSWKSASRNLPAAERKNPASPGFVTGYA